MRLNGHNWLHSADLFAQERPLRIQGGHQVRAFIHSTIKEAKVFAGIKSPQSLRLSGLSVERPKEKASKPKQVVHQEEYIEIIQHGDRLAMAPTSGNTGTATLIPSNTKAFKKLTQNESRCQSIHLSGIQQGIQGDRRTDQGSTRGPKASNKG